MEGILTTNVISFSAPLKYKTAKAGTAESDKQKGKVSVGFHKPRQAALRRPGQPMAPVFDFRR